MEMREKKGKGCPMGGGIAAGGGALEELSEGALTYGDYLKVPELLALQIPQSNPIQHDELLFIVIHQAYELWFKLILHEMETSISLIEKNQVFQAHHLMTRIGEIFDLLVRQIHIL